MRRTRPRVGPALVAAFALVGGGCPGRDAARPCNSDFDCLRSDRCVDGTCETAPTGDDDAGAAADAGARGDGGGLVDGGAPIDGGAAADGGASLDGGTNDDGGVGADGGADPDGGATVDAGANVDAGADVDGGAEVDAGRYADVVLAAAPLVHLRFVDAGVGDVVAPAQSVEVVDGPASFATPGVGDDDSAIVFAGATTYLEIDNPLPGGVDGDFTFEVWARPDVASATGADGIFGDVNNPRIQWGDFDVDTRAFVFFVSDGADGTKTRSIGGGLSVELDVWHHVVAVVSAAVGGDDVSLYVDGVFVDGTPLWFFARRPNPTIMLRRRDATTTYQGAIDEVAVYDRALTAEEIAAHHAAGAPASGG